MSENRMELFFILLLAVVGETLAWCSTLGVEPDFPAVCLGVAAWTLAAYLVWYGAGKGQAAVRLAGAAAFWAGVGIWWSEGLRDGALLALQPMLHRINMRYDTNMVLGINEAAGEPELASALIFFLAPQIMLLGYAVMRRRSGAAAVVYLAPALVSCFGQAFPEYPSIVCMTLALGMMTASSCFRSDRAAERKAVLAGFLVTALLMSAVYLFLLSPIDRLYEEINGMTGRLKYVVNDRFMPYVKEVWNWQGWFRTGSIDGNLDKADGFSYTQAELFEVTADEMPQSVVYLRGFVGSDYTGGSWEAETDEALERYYRERGYPLPEDYAVLMNYTYRVLEETREGTGPCVMTVRELLGDNAYSLYPYGTKLEENGTVHGDGSLEKQGEACTYEYYPVWNFDGRDREGAERSREDALYREYVYDTFLDYPKDRLPGLTAWLQENRPAEQGSWYAPYWTVNLLEQTAVYSVNAQGAIDGSDFVESFLFEQKEGYCTHFASAAVLMLRYAGIPARYATGYCVSPGEFAENGQEQFAATVKDSQAHAWAEIYLDTIGWVPLEATPGDIALSYDNREELLQQIEAMTAADFSGIHSEDEMSEAEEEDAEEDEEEDAEEDEEADRDKAQRHGNEGEEDLEDASWTVDAGEALAGSLVVLSAAAGLCWLALFLYQRGKKRAYGNLSPADRVCEQYRTLVKTLLRAEAQAGIGADRKLLEIEVDRMCMGVEPAGFRRYLLEVERCTFGDKQPDMETVQRMEAYSRELRKRIYRRMSLVRRKWMIWENDHVDSGIEQSQL